MMQQNGAPPKEGPAPVSVNDARQSTRGDLDPQGPRGAPAPAARGRVRIPEARAAVAARTGGLCHLCGAPLGAAFDVDHARPHATGGGLDLANLWPACPSCNRSRGAGPADLDPWALAYAIAGRLAALGLGARVGRPRRGPLVTTVPITPEAGALAAVLAAGPEIGAALGGLPVRMAPLGGGCAAEVPRRDRPRVILADLGAPAPFGLRLPLGLEAAGGLVVTLDLAKAPHVVIVGQTGGGKSTLLRAIAAGAARAGAALMLLDSDGATFGPFARSGALLAPTSEAPVDHARALAAVLAAMHGRPLDPEARRPWVILIDEVQRLCPRGRAALGALLSEGRKYGLHLVAATQYPRADFLSTPAMDQAPVRIAFRLGAPIAARAVGLPGAESLTGAGDCLIASGGGPALRMLAAWPADSEVEAAAGPPRAGAPWALDWTLTGAPKGLDPEAPPEAAALAAAVRTARLAPALAWARAEGPAVTAAAIRRRFAIGQDVARAIRDKVRSEQVEVTDLTDERKG